MDNALSIIGFYFTLIGFVGGLFFTRLDGWYGQVREFWGSMKLLDKEPDKIDKSRQARIVLNGLKESAPKGSFIAVGAFTTVLSALSFFVPVGESTVNPLIFVRLPLVVTVSLYWIGGVILLRKGNQLLRVVSEQISNVLPRA